MEREGPISYFNNQVFTEHVHLYIIYANNVHAFHQCKKTPVNYIEKK